MAEKNGSTAKAATSVAYPGKPKVSAIVGAVLGLALFVAIWFAPPVLGLESVGMHMLAVLALAIMFWVFQPIPSEFTALLVIALPALMGIVPLDVAVSGFKASTTWFLFGGLIIGKMISNSGLDKRITLNIVRRVGGADLNIWKVLVAIFILCIVFTAVIPSATVLALILAAQVFPLLELYGVGKDSQLAKMLMVMLPVFILLCGNESLSGSAHNLVILGCLDDAGIGVSWLGWFLAILPDTLIVGVVMLLWCRAFGRPEVSTVGGGREYITEQLHALGEFSPREKKAAVYFVIALVLWVTNGVTHIPIWMTALGVGILCLLPVIGCMEFRPTIKGINWLIIIFVVAVLGIPSMMEACGMNEAFALLFNTICGSFDTPWLFVVLMWIMAQVTSWLGLAVGAPVLIMPFMFPIASALGVPPLYAGLLQGYLQPAIMYYHAPAPLVVHDYGCFHQSDYIKYQLVVTVVKILVTPLLFGLWWPFLSSVGIL